jgi:IclR family KDG regulon transcriptional repressor
MPANETQSLHRAIAILDCFRDVQPELGVREIARQLELHPSTVGRMLATMTSLGILTQDKESHRYRMGSKVLRWSAVYTGSVDLRSEARPYIEELHSQTEETVSLDIPDGDARICVERIESPHRLRWVARIGERMPYFASASGKTLLSFMPPAQQDKLLSSMRMEKLTPKTTADLKTLRHELEIIKQRGYAVSEGERVEGVCCVAAPVFDTTGKAVGAITISGPSTRFSQSKIRQYAQLLIRATARLSRTMGSASQATEATASRRQDPDLWRGTHDRHAVAD